MADVDGLGREGEDNLVDFVGLEILENIWAEVNLEGGCSSSLSSVARRRRLDTGDDDGRDDAGEVKKVLDWPP